MLEDNILITHYDTKERLGTHMPLVTATIMDLASSCNSIIYLFKKNNNWSILKTWSLYSSLQSIGMCGGAGLSLGLTNSNVIRQLVNLLLTFRTWFVGFKITLTWKNILAIIIIMFNIINCITTDFVLFTWNCSHIW